MKVMIDPSAGEKKERVVMLSKWIKPRRLLVAVGVVVISWATLQTTEGVASGEFLTDRIGEGSVLQASLSIRPEFDGHVLYFQDGQPLNLTQVKVDRPYCKFTSAQKNIGESLARSHRLTVSFKNVARARWFFDHGVDLECMSPHGSILESDFNRSLGQYFQIEKHSNSHPERTQWGGEGAV
jgi:hypothetical protein